jgi:hypothetical protein
MESSLFFPDAVQMIGSEYFTAALKSGLAYAMSFLIAIPAQIAYCISAFCGTSAAW